jgi:hypothetical protein
VASGGGYALTCGQRWLLHLLDRSPALARPVQRIYRLERALDTAALLAAFRQVVSSHPALRMRLIRTGEGRRQAFPEIEAEVSGLSIRGLTSDIQAAYAREALAEEAATTFDLETQPPFLAKVIEMNGEYLFSLCLDHLAADDLATDVLERDLAAAYAREKRDDAHPPSTAARDFYDMLARETAQQTREAGNLEYWRKRLAGAPLGRHEGEEIEWVPGAALHWRLCPDAFRALNRACRAQQCSVFAAVLGAHAKLLCELANTDDMVLNVPVSNRTRASDHGLVANLSMLLHLRVRLENNQAPGRLLSRMRDDVLEAMTHRQYDYAALSEAVAADAAARGGRAHWLTGCSYMQNRTAPLGGSGLFTERLDNQPADAFDIPRSAFLLTVRQSESGLRFAAEWDPSLWRVDVSGLAARYMATLGRLAGIDLEWTV